MALEAERGGSLFLLVQADARKAARRLTQALGLTQPFPGNFMNKFWNAAFAFCGFSAVAAFVFWSLYKQWLALPIFERLTQQQTFIVMLVFLVLAFAGLIAMLVVYMRNPNPRHRTAANDTNARIQVADAIDEFFATFYSASYQVAGVDPDELRRQPEKIDPHLQEIERTLLGTKVLERMSISIDVLASTGFSGLSRSSGIISILQSVRAQIALGSNEGRYAMLGVIAAINGRDVQAELRGL